MSTVNQYERRYSRWYEILLMNRGLQFVVGLVWVVVLPALIVWGESTFRIASDSQVNSVWAAGLAFAVIVYFLHRIERYSGGDAWAHIGSIVTVVFLLAFAAFLFTRAVYSRPMLLWAYVLTLVWCYGGYFLARRYRRRKFAVVPMNGSYELQSTPQMEFRPLAEPDLKGVRYDGIVADLRGHRMTPEWERFLAQCILSHIPVFHVRYVVERMTGRVQIDHLSENEVGALLPSLAYVSLKRLFDIIGVLVTLPITLPLGLLTAIAIRLDSPGPALFSQDRVGLSDGDFRIYKFRSMRVNAESNGASFAMSDDDRITRVGRFIRKTRLDELPQLWNVLKGDMSWIGPRPEQRFFVEQFNEEIPFYIYRHVVRPGITGWAQVTQGYAASADETRVKIQHDFYYIKHFSFWLDVLITIKTIRILITGWGAR